MDAARRAARFNHPARPLPARPTSAECPPPGSLVAPIQLPRATGSNPAPHPVHPPTAPAASERAIQVPSPAPPPRAKVFKEQPRRPRRCKPPLALAGPATANRPRPNPRQTDNRVRFRHHPRILVDKPVGLIPPRPARRIFSRHQRPGGRQRPRMARVQPLLPNPHPVAQQIQVDPRFDVNQIVHPDSSPSESAPATAPVAPALLPESVLPPLAPADQT